MMNNYIINKYALRYMINGTMCASQEQIEWISMQRNVKYHVVRLLLCRNFKTRSHKLNSTTAVTGANVEKIPGLNTLSVSLARIDYTPGGWNTSYSPTRHWSRLRPRSWVYFLFFIFSWSWVYHDGKQAFLKNH